MTCIVATIRVEPSVLVFLAFISKSINNQCYNPYFFGKIFSSSTIWSKENGRIRKFIVDNSGFKKNKVQTEIVCYKFSNSSVFFRPYCRARKDLSENVWVVALIVYRFRDKSENTSFRHLSAKQRTKVSSPGYKGVP